MFKAACAKLATAWDWNAKCVKRNKGDGEKLRRYARRKIKMNDLADLKKEADHAE